MIKYNSNRKGITILLLLALLLQMNLTGCAVDGADHSGETSGSETEKQTIDVSSDDGEDKAENSGGNAASIPLTNVDTETDSLWKAKDIYSDYNDGIAIDLNTPGTGEGYTVSGSVITITKGGTYVISGTLADGQIIVDAPKTADVRLVLENAAIHCSTASPIEVKTADKVIVSLPEGTTNTLSNGAGLVPESDEEASSEDVAAIMSKEDLTINGTGTLEVTANSGDGIRSKDTLKITGGNLVVTAADRGLVGKDSVLIKDAAVSITSGGDGIKSNNAEDASLGYIYIESGTFNIASQKDGIQAETLLEIRGGTFDITTGTGSYESQSTESFGFGGGGRGGFMNMFGFGSDSGDSEDTEESLKGLKAGSGLNITGGTISINAYDDAIHSDGFVTIADGVISAASGDDGIHAEETVTISGGNLAITRSYEGIEGKVIEITGGTTSITASDDGLNATDGTGDTMGMFNMGGGNSGSASEIYVHISGGELYVDARGDGLDSNSTLTIDGGVVVVMGPSDSANGYIDTAGSFWMNGGTYLGVGSSGMMVTPASDSAQNSITVTGSSCPAGSVITVKDSAGNELFSAEAVRQFNALTFSSDAVELNGEYSVYADDQLMGTVTAGSSGSSSGFGGGFGGFGGNMGGGKGGRGDKFSRGDSGNTAETDETAPEMPEIGEIPADGMMPDMFGGEMPEMPTDGTMPELPDGMEIPEGMPADRFGGGEIPEMGGMRPDMPADGNMPEVPEGGAL